MTMDKRAKVAELLDALEACATREERITLLGGTIDLYANVAFCRANGPLSPAVLRDIAEVVEAEWPGSTRPR